MEPIGITTKIKCFNYVMFYNTQNHCLLLINTSIYMKLTKNIM